MLSISNISNAAQAASYFERDDYYAGGAQVAPSSWWGKGAERLGLQGEVDRAVFAKLLEGELPDGSSIAKKQGRDHRPGVDLTFSAPKSVSLLALVRGDERVVLAHEKAVGEALAYLESTSAQVRQTEGSRTEHVLTDNLVVARFIHDASRLQDPQLHTHCVVLNLSQRKDGAWRALTNEDLYRAKMTAGAIYRGVLAQELRSMGYGIERTHSDGRFEVAGFSPEALERFSERRQQIERALAERGEDGPEASAKAALVTRAAKREVDRQALRVTWQQEALELGLTFPEANGERVRPGRGGAARVVDHAIAHLSERSAVFGERELLRVAVSHGLGEVAPAAIRAEVERRRRGGELRDAEPRSRSNDDLSRHFTTPELLALEGRLIRAVQEGRGRVVSILEPTLVHQELPRFGLTEDQAKAVVHVLGSRDAVTGVQGYAGTGKTTMLRSVRELAEAQGFTVRGFAPSAAAAQLLSSEAQISSTTLAQHLLTEGRAPGRLGDARELWVVDEVSMVGVKDSLKLVELARARGARLLLLGDEQQLPSIEAGSAFELLSSQALSRVEMRHILRQKDAQLLQAVKETIQHRSDRAIEALGERILAVPDRGERLGKVAEAYLAESPERRRSALVLTASNQDRRELNRRVREGLRREGVLTGAEQAANVLVARDFTKAQASTVASYEVGDVVRFGRSYRRFGAEKGDYFKVDGIDRESGVVRLAGGDREVLWDPAKASKVEVYRPEARALAAGDRIRWTRNDHGLGRRNGEEAVVLAVDTEQGRARVRVGEKEQVVDLSKERHWDHAYVVTVHAAQGRTADRVFLHLDTSQQQLTGHESWYVAISRAKHELRIFTDDVQRLPGRVQRSMAQAMALEGVRDRGR